MHPSTTELLQHFDYGHLPSWRMRTIGAKCHDLAHEIAFDGQLEGQELTAGLRKLLEAKDCFVRAARLVDLREKEGHSTS